MDADGAVPVLDVRAARRLVNLPSGAEAHIRKPLERMLQLLAAPLQGPTPRGEGREVGHGCADQVTPDAIEPSAIHHRPVSWRAALALPESEAFLRGAFGESANDRSRSVGRLRSRDDPAKLSKELKRWGVKRESRGWRCRGDPL